MIITIDGPTASGKSTVGRLLAKRLNSYYLYTGLLYRALAYLLMKKHGHTLETIAHPEMKHIDELLDQDHFVYQYDPEDRERIFYNEQDITPCLQDDTIGQAASILSTNSEVRECLNILQRKIANDHDVVIDGRDSGSVVFPHAQHKFFLTASEDERIARWRAYQEKQGHPVTFEHAQAFISSRDQRDSNRAIAPLTIPIGAHVIDNTGKTVSETLEHIMQILS